MSLRIAAWEGGTARLEFTVLEPTVIDKKIYAPGLGIVKEQSVHGPQEVATLVSVHG